EAFRGDPLPGRDEQTRTSLQECDGMVDLAAVTAVWEEALEAQEWSRPRVWIHCDLTPLNLLNEEGRPAAVIDWSGAGLGDPAVDVKAAWTCLDARARAIFRSELAVGDDMWLRSKG